jgi:outer membrane protein
MSELSIAGKLVAAAALSLPLWTFAAEPEKQWRFSAGGGVVILPEYPGSDDQRTRFVPVFSATYGRFFIGTDPDIPAPGGIGVDLYRDRGLRLGVAAYSDLTEREESDDERLRGLGDVDRDLRVGVFASYSFSRYVLRASIGSDVSDNDQGTLVRLDALARFHPSERLTLTAGPGLTWADSEYTRTFFGVDAGQSARSGLPQYEAKSGINSARFALGANYRIDPSWTLGAFFVFARLHGDATDSPITQDKSQNVAGAFAVYRF